MVDLYIARDANGEYWIFNCEPENDGTTWVAPECEAVFIGESIDVYLDYGEAKPITGLDIQVD